VNTPGAGSAGNPNLRPTKSTNIDATLEYYFPKNGFAPRFGQDRHVKAATFVDLSLSYEISKNISLQFDASNLTREKFESYLNDPIRPRDIRYNPTTYGLGLRFTL
jgi:outer membrane receptor protein involved in Fe transport